MSEKPLSALNMDEVMEKLGLEPWEIHKAKAIVRNDETMTKTHGSHWRKPIYDEIISRGIGRTWRQLMIGFMAMLRGQTVYVSAHNDHQEKDMVTTLRQWARLLGIDTKLAQSYRKARRKGPKPGDPSVEVIHDHYYPEARIHGRSAHSLFVDEPLDKTG